MPMKEAPADGHAEHACAAGRAVQLTSRTNTYSKREILRMELSILKALKYKLAVPTPCIFLHRFIKASTADWPPFSIWRCRHMTLTAYQCGPLMSRLLHNVWHSLWSKAVCIGSQNSTWRATESTEPGVLCWQCVVICLKRLLRTMDTRLYPPGPSATECSGSALRC